MTENQRVHRLLGRLLKSGKKTLFYDELLEDFNDGLWFDKIDEKELINVCQTLVRDELAHFIEGSHPSTVQPSDRASSKGITINNNAYTAFEEKRYAESSAPGRWRILITVVSLIAAVAAVAYVYYLKNDFERQRKQSQLDNQEVIAGKDRVIAQKDSLVAAKDSLINRQKARIKELEQPPPPPPRKARR